MRAPRRTPLTRRHTVIPVLALPALLAADAPGGGISPEVTLAVAAIGAIGAFGSPIVVALIGRSGRAKPLDLPAEVAMPRSQYDGLLDVLATQSDEAARRDSEFARRAAELEARHDAEVARLRGEQASHRSRCDADLERLRRELDEVRDELDAMTTRAVRAETRLEALGG